MKQLFCLLMLLLLSSQISYALSPQQRRLAYEHLYEVNIQWQHFPQAAPSEYVKFTNDIERIAYHLHHVEAYLRENTPKSLSKKALTNRMHLLDELKEYANAKVFPQNIYHKERTPYFIDHRGVHCAVGYLIKVSGHADLAQRIKKEQNYDYLRDIKTPGVLEWANEFGFTFKELEWIQPGYSYYIYTDLDNGINGTVYDFEEGDGKLYLTGEFTEVGNAVPCSGVAVYANNQLTCVGSGLSGTLRNATVLDNDILMVTGSIQDQGTTYPLAKYENGAWSYIAIPGRNGATSSAFAATTDTSQYKMTVAISHSSIPGQQEIWMQETATSNWVKKATVYGTVNAIEGDYYGGVFDSLIIHQTVDTTILAYNALQHDSNLDEWSDLGMDFPDTIKTIELDGVTAYFGGSAIATDSSGILITKYTAGSAQGFLYAAEMSDTTYTSVNGIAASGNQVYFVGQFHLQILLGNVGFQAGVYHTVGEYLDGMGQLNGEVYDVVSWNASTIAGGNYTVNLDTVNHFFAVADLQGSTNGQQAVGLAVNAFPNPTTGQLTFNFEETMQEIELTITDLSGRVLQQAAFSSQSQVELALEAPAGLYLAKVIADGRQSLLKIVKQ